MQAAFRSIAAIFAGLIVLFVLVVAVELFSAVVYPLPADFNGTKEEMCLHVARYPQWILGVVVPAWGVAAFVSTWVARRIGNLYSALTVGLLLLVALMANLAMLPYPVWFNIANLLVAPAAIVAGSGLMPRPRNVPQAG